MEETRPHLTKALLIFIHANVHDFSEKGCGVVFIAIFFCTVYVDMSQAKQAYLSVRLNTKSDMDRRWSIRITQISCWSPGLGNYLVSHD